MNFKNVEVDSLGQRSAFSNGGNVSFLDSETRRAVGNKVRVSLLISVVLLNKVKVVSSDDNCVFHLMRDDHTSKNLSSDRDVASERAFLIDVVSFDGLLWGFEAETDFSEVSWDSLVLRDHEFLVVGEDSFLLLVTVFSLLDHVIDL